MEETLTLRLSLLLALLFASAFFAGCDIALFSLTSARVQRLKQTRGRLGARVAALLERPQRLLVTIYVGNELVNVAIAAVATFIALDLLGNVGVALALGAGVLALLIFGEITPKALAHTNNEAWSLAAAYPLTVFMWLVYPVQAAVSWIANSIARMFGASMDIEHSVLTEDDLKTLMEESADEGIIDEDEKEMIRNVFELGDVTVTEVMTPRTDILALEVSSPLIEAWDKMAQSYYARAPVYEETIDNVVGVLFKKDLLKLSYPLPENISLKDLIREPFIVPETVKINELLREFRKRKVHIAIIMNEYGGVQGVVTMDDILEELVGESKAPHGRNGDEILQLGSDVWRVSASAPLERFNEYFGSELRQEGIETVGGYVFHLFGRAPKWGESVAGGGFEFTIEKERGHRIIELRVRRTEQPAAEERTLEEEMA